MPDTDKKIEKGVEIKGKDVGVEKPGVKIVGGIHPTETKIIEQGR